MQESRQKLYDPSVAEIEADILSPTSGRLRKVGDYTYRLTLQIDHPDADLSEIPVRLGLQAKVIARKGDPIVAPNGRVTGAIYRNSYCAIPFGSYNESDLPKGLRSALATLLPHKTFLGDWSRKDAKYSFFVGWFSDFNSGAVLDWEILRDLSELRISLDLDFYGPDAVQSDT